MTNRKGTVAAAACFLALGLTGCVAPGPVYDAMVCGHQVTYHPDDLQPCARGAAACTLRQGASAYDVHYSTLDTGVIDHENEHVCGMHHREPWVSVAGVSCTEVTEAGASEWKIGDVMCRVDSGPPVRITDARMLSNIASSARWPALQDAAQSIALAAAQARPEADPAPGAAQPQSDSAANPDAGGSTPQESSPSYLLEWPPLAATVPGCVPCGNKRIQPNYLTLDLNKWGFFNAL